jgi:hypothetical protein
MKNYKNISLLLLLSTTSITHAFDPYNTSGVPDVSDFDDQSGGPLPTPRSWDYGQTSLEKEVKKQNPTPPKSTVYPTQLPTKKDANPFFEKQRQRQEEEKRKKETAAENAHDADTLVYQLTELYKQIEYRNAALSEAESSYQSALENLTAQRKFGRYEKVGMITATLAAAAALVTTSVEDAPKYVVLHGHTFHDTVAATNNKKRSPMHIQQNLNKQLRSHKEMVLLLQKKNSLLKQKQHSNN